MATGTDRSTIPMRKTPETLNHEKTVNGGKAKARHPAKPITNRPGGEGGKGC